MEHSLLLELREQIAHKDQKIAELREELRRYRELESPQINELSAALAKAQGEYSEAVKNCDNPFFKSSYAGYEDLARATRPALTKYGLSVHTVIVVRNDKQYARTVMRHSSGQFTTSESIVNPMKNDPQSEGSCRSYKHRYGYREITGVVVKEDGDDDDGEAAMHRNNIPAHSSQYVTKEQLDMIEYELKGDNDLKYDMLEKLKIDTLGKIPQSSFVKVINRIREIKALK